MKSILITLSLILLSFHVLAQPTPNIIIQTINCATAASGTYSKASIRSEQVSLDGFGKAVCQAALDQSPSGKDIITITHSDPFGRIVKARLPYSGEAGSLTQMIADQELYYRTALKQSHTNYPFTEYSYDPAPNQMLLMQSFPGQSWHMGSGREQKQQFRLNQTGEIRCISALPNGTLQDNAFFPAGSLSISVLTDEDGTISRTYHDAAGSLIMKAEAWGSPDQAITYYVYDRYRMLRTVIPPKAFALLSGNIPIAPAALPQNLLFRFEYDGQGRIVAKHVPSEGWTEFVYDRMGRPVMSRDEIQKSQGQWWVKVYDFHDRPVAEGLLNDPLQRDRLTWQNLLNTIFNGQNPENPSISRHSSNSERYIYPSFLSSPDWNALIQYYYDDYTGITQTLSSPGMQSGTASRPSGMLCARLSRQLDDLNQQWLGESFLYDDDGNIVLRISSFPNSGRLEERMTYSLDGALLTHKQSWAFPYGYSPASLELEYTYTYDAGGRLIEERVITGGKKYLLQRLNYNESGQLTEKNIGYREASNDPLQSIDYSYNPRGWLNAINNATLTNDKAALLFSDDPGSTESLAAIVFEEISLNIVELKENGDVNILFGDSKELEYDTQQSNSVTLVSSEESELLEWASAGLDSIAVIELQALEGEFMMIDLNNLMVGEGQNPQTILDTALSRISRDLLSQGLEDPGLILELSTAVVSYMKGRLNQAYRNDDSNDLFGMEIAYDDIAVPGRRFDGNISRITWRSRSANHPGMRYDYSYDALDRLTAAQYRSSDNTGIWLNLTEDFSLPQVSYDLNGNILSLKRKGLLAMAAGGAKSYGLIDDLYYQYEGNRLRRVDDGIPAASPAISGYHAIATGTQDMAYNAKGQLVNDPGRGISLNYNTIGMTSSIQTSQPAGHITVVYDAAGRKLYQQSVTAAQTHRTDWYGSAVCRDQALAWVRFSEGRIAWVNGQPRFEFELKDHLGSVRMVVSDANEDGLPELLQENHYYPFGAEMGGKTQFAGAYSNTAQFTSKELIERDIFDWYDFGARIYDPLLGRWHSVDPLAGNACDWTAYNAMWNNPIVNIDPDGRWSDNFTILSNGTIYKEETADKTNTYTYLDLNTMQTTDLGTYEKRTNSKGEDMVKIGEAETGENDVFKWSGIASGNLYFEEDAFAGVLGGVKNFYDNAELQVEKVQFNQFMSLERVHSNKENRNSALDVAFYSTDGKTGAITSNKNISKDLNTQLLESLTKFGIGSKAVYTSTSANSRIPYLSGTKGLPGHHHHFHFEGFDQRVIIK